MVKLSDHSIGFILKDEFEGVTRELLRKYAKSSGDTNPIHTNDVIAERAGLKGIIAHGLFSTGLITKLFEDHLDQGRAGNLVEVNIEMRGMVRCGDRIITEATINKIEGKRAAEIAEEHSGAAEKDQRCYGKAEGALGVSAETGRGDGAVRGVVDRRVHSEAVRAGG